MGYGAGHGVKLNGQYGYAIFNGLNLHIVAEDTDFTSWDFTHPMDGMTKIRMDLLNIEFKIVKLTREGRRWLKADGYKKGERIYFTWDKSPEGQLWSGYVRSPLNDSFPIELTGIADMGNGLGCFEVTIIITPSDMENFKYFIEDVLDFCPEEHLTDEDGREISFEEQYETQEDANRINYGA